MKRGLNVSFAAMAVCLTASGAFAQALVINGEQIADEALMKAAKAEGKVVVYGNWPERNWDPAIQATFPKETGLQLEFIRMGTQVLYPRVLAEANAGRLDADLIDITDPVLRADLTKRNILNTPHKVPSFDKISASAKEADGRWYAWFRLPFVFGINKALVKPEDEPKSWNDLLKPRFKGKVSMNTLDGGGGAFAIWEFVKMKVSPDYWEKMRDNAVRIYPSTTPMLTDLVRGETDIAVMGVTSFQAQEQEGAPLKTIFPEEGSPVLEITGGIVSSTKRPNAAKVFLNWVTSKHAGALISEQKAVPSNSDAPLPVLLDGRKYAPINTYWAPSLDDWEKLREPESEKWRQVFGKK